MNSHSTEVDSFTPTLPVHSQDFGLITTFGVKKMGKMKQQAEAHLIIPTTECIPFHSKSCNFPRLQTQSKGFESKTQPSSMNNKINRGPISPNLRLPSVASATALQGQLNQNHYNIQQQHLK